MEWYPNTSMSLIKSNIVHWVCNAILAPMFVLGPFESLYHDEEAILRENYSKNATMDDPTLELHMGRFIEIVNSLCFDDGTN